MEKVRFEPNFFIAESKVIETSTKTVGQEFKSCLLPQRYLPKCYSVIQHESNVLLFVG